MSSKTIAHGSFKLYHELMLGVAGTSDEGECSVEGSIIMGDWQRGATNIRPSWSNFTCQWYSGLIRLETTQASSSCNSLQEWYRSSAFAVD
jgi:hypothetical protein